MQCVVDEKHDLRREYVVQITGRVVGRPEGMENPFLATGDIDVLVRPDRVNAERVCAALRAFGAPLQAHGVGPDELSVEGNVYQLGLPPRTSCT